MVELESGSWNHEIHGAAEARPRPRRLAVLPPSRVLWSGSIRREGQVVIANNPQCRWPGECRR